MLDVSKPTKIIVIILGLIGVFLLGWMSIRFFNTPVYKLDITVKIIVTFIVLGILGFVFKSLAKFINYKSTIAKYLSMGFIMIALFILNNTYLGTFNGIYNKAGRLKEK